MGSPSKVNVVDADLEERDLQKFFESMTSSLGCMVEDPTDNRPRVIVLSGPTGVGKSARSVEIAQAIGGEVVSADSVQVYKGMDIGSAKVLPVEQRGIPHHLIDVREIHEQYNVLDFYNDATRVIEDVLSRGKVPIVVGGSGFYVHTLLYGPPPGPPPDKQVREGIEREMDKSGVEAVYAYLKEYDPEYAETISSNDRHKILRALEIVGLTKGRVSDLKIAHPNVLPYDFRCWFLYMPRTLLYKQIEARCTKMLQQGLLNEVLGLIGQGIEQNGSAKRSVGYKQILEYLKGEQNSVTYEKMVSSFKTASRRYAKRQFTWFKKEPLFRWMDISVLSFAHSVEMIIQDFEVGF